MRKWHKKRADRPLTGLMDMPHVDAAVTRTSGGRIARRTCKGWLLGKQRPTVIPEPSRQGSQMLEQRRTLLAVLVGRGEHTLSEIIDGFERCARSNGEDATLSVRTLRRWMSGDLRTQPRPAQRRVAHKFWGFPVTQLLAPASDDLMRSAQTGAPVAGDDRIASPGGTSPALPAALSQRPFRAMTTSLQAGEDSTFSGAHNHRMPSDGQRELSTLSEWPEWFGLRLPHLLAIIDNWRGPSVEVGSLQHLLHQEILMFDAMSPDDGDPAYGVSRRQALITIAALPLTFSTGALGHAATVDFFMSRCAASLTACWHLMKGSDLSAVDRMLSPYLLELERIAQQQSAYQDAAARLASQAHRISGIIALHRDQLRMREYHCKQAVRYAEFASDLSSRVSALVSLASTYFYDATPLRAANMYERAFAFDEGMSPLQRSRVHAELSVVYGQLGREQDALRSCRLAEELYPEVPEQDSSFLYAEFTRASLTLERGLAHVALARQYPGKRYQSTAAGIFAQMEQASPATVPDRIRYEILNHQASTAVLLGDLDAFEGHIDRAAEGVIRLGSRQRQKEMHAAWQWANEKWGREPRLKAIGQRIGPLVNGLARSTDMTPGRN